MRPLQLRRWERALSARVPAGAVLAPAGSPRAPWRGLHRPPIVPKLPPTQPERCEEPMDIKYAAALINHWEEVHEAVSPGQVAMPAPWEADAASLAVFTGRQPFWNFLVATSGYLDENHALVSEKVRAVTQGLRAGRHTAMITGIEDYASAIGLADTDQMLRAGGMISRVVPPGVIARSGLLVVNLGGPINLCQTRCGPNPPCIVDCLRRYASAAPATGHVGP